MALFLGWRIIGHGGACVLSKPQAAANRAGRHGFLLIINGFVKFAGMQPGQETMKKTAPGSKGFHDFDEEDKEALDANFKRLSAEEARELRERSPQISPWRVIAGQILAGLLAALVAWGLTGQQNYGWSAGYGALSVVIPAAVFARGLTGRLASLNPSTAVMAFFVWEMVKMALTVAMLFAAPRLITALSWPAMLAGLVVAMQAYWAVIVFAPKRK